MIPKCRHLVLWSLLLLTLMSPGLYANAATFPDTGPQSLAQAKHAILVNHWFDRYRRLLDDFDFGGVTHPNFGKRVVENKRSLQVFSEKMSAALRDLDLCRDDQADLLLWRFHVARQHNLMARNSEHHRNILKLLPAADLRDRLPVLTGLLGDIDVADMVSTLKQARREIPAPWAPVPSGLTFNVAKDAKTRARYLNDMLGEWMDRVKDRFPDDADAIASQVSAIREGLEGFGKWIDDEVLPSLEDAEGAYGDPVGEAAFVAMLHNKHMIDKTPRALIALGRENLAQLHARIEELSREIDPTATPDQVWQQLKEDHPSREDLPQFAYDEMQRAMDLLLASNAITIPEYARENVMELTEGRIYETFPFGAYGGWDWRDGKIVGKFVTSPPKAWLPAAEQKARLLGNNVYWARVVAVHEMYPGHHLSSVVAAWHARPMRRMFRTETNSEGWGLYSETMMFRLGFFPDKATELAMVKMQVWRAARIVIDVSLHLGLMSVEEAVTFLVDNVSMTPENARAEVRRYLGYPTRPMSYLYGFRQIEALRAKVMAKQGDAFDPRAFHDRFLHMGSIPIPVIEALMLGTPLPDLQPFD